MACHKPSMLHYQVFLREKTMMGNFPHNVGPLLTLYLKGFSESIIQIESQQFILNLYILSWFLHSCKQETAVSSS